MLRVMRRTAANGLHTPTGYNIHPRYRGCQYFVLLFFVSIRAEEHLLSIPTAEELGASSRILSGVSLQEKRMTSLLEITLLSLIITKKETFLFHPGRGVPFLRPL